MKSKDNLGDYIIRNYGQNFLNKIWSDKNEKTAFEYPPHGRDSAWFKCPDGLHEDECRVIDNATRRDFKCKKCSVIKQHNTVKYESSLEYWCINNERQDILDLWDYKLNDIPPSKVSFGSNAKKYYFKCKRGLHESELHYVNDLTNPVRQRSSDLICKACQSFGQYLLDEKGQEEFDKVQQFNSDVNLFKISKSSAKSEIELQCTKMHPRYRTSPSTYHRTDGCPYCAGKRVCKENSLGTIHPQTLVLWSDKNELTPYDFTPGSKEKVWWKCENEKHEDYQRMISRSVTYEFRCPICGKENQKHPRGEEHPCWKGDAVDPDRRARTTPEYKEWRTKIYARDNYTCQCCGQQGGRLNAHHFYSFAEFEDLRLDPMNGLTLCETCHATTSSVSFHSLYGTHNTTPAQLESYINQRRKQLGINIPFTIESYQQGDIFTSPILLSINTDKDLKEA